MNTKITKKIVEQMAGGYLPFESVEDGKSWLNPDSFRVILKTDGFNIGNLEALKERGFELLAFGITDDDKKLYIEFEVAKPKVREEFPYRY
jgi:hypothetical protein